MPEDTTNTKPFEMKPDEVTKQAAVIGQLGVFPQAKSELPNLRLLAGDFPAAKTLQEKVKAKATEVVTSMEKISKVFQDFETALQKIVNDTKNAEDKNAAAAVALAVMNASIIANIPNDEVPNPATPVKPPATTPPTP